VYRERQDANREFHGTNREHHGTNREHHDANRELHGTNREHQADREQPGNEIRRAAVEYLLLKRSEDEALYPGLWQMITGMIEHGESALEAARRELREETGIVTDHLLIVPCIPSFYSPADDAVHNIPVFALKTPCNTEVTLSDEHQDFCWLDFEAALQLLSFPGHKEGLITLRDFIIDGDGPVSRVDFIKH